MNCHKLCECATKRWSALLQIRAARGWEEDILLSCSCEGSVLDSQCALSTLPAGTISCLAFQASGSTENAEREASFSEAQQQHGDWVRAAERWLCLRHATPGACW